MSEQIWDKKLNRILADVSARALKLFAAGLLVYGGGTGVILTMVGDRSLALVLQMFLFQLCVMYFGVLEMYKCLRGAFLTNLEVSRDTMPVFDRLASVAEKLEAKSADADRVFEKFERLIDKVSAQVDADPVKRIESKIDQAVEEIRELAPDGGPDIGRGIAALRAAPVRVLPMAGGNGNGNATKTT